MVHWLGHHAFIAEGPGSIPGLGTKIQLAVWHSQKKKKNFSHNLNSDSKYQIDDLSWIEIIAEFFLLISFGKT